VDLETVRRFDRPGPRYTSYPTAVEFHEGVREETYREHLARADAAGTDVPLCLYVHLPFCEHRCLFCGCHVVITPHREVAGRYLDYLMREMDRVAALLPRRRRVVQMQWGGGTPTYYTPAELETLFRHLSGIFDFDEGAEIAIEVDPRITTPEHLDRLTELGFNRLSMGVQDLTQEVQEAITRNQTYEQTRALMEYARTVGFAEGINLDLIYGLPRQEPESFGRNLEQVLELRPDRVALYSFAYIPWIKGHQKKLDPATLPPPEVKLQLYLMAMERFLDAGYEPIGMDHFALPDDELAEAARAGRLHRNFMGYTVQPAPDMVAFGISGIGEVRGAFFQNEKKLSSYYAALDRGASRCSAATCWTRTTGSGSSSSRSSCATSGSRRRRWSGASGSTSTPTSSRLSAGWRRCGTRDSWRRTGRCCGSRSRVGSSCATSAWPSTGTSRRRPPTGRPSPVRSEASWEG